MKNRTPNLGKKEDDITCLAKYNGSFIMEQAHQILSSANRSYLKKNGKVNTQHQEIYIIKRKHSS
jgi:hypothetical protein